MSAPPFRIGHGCDLHQLTNGRKLILGGVEIPMKRIVGHSDTGCLIRTCRCNVRGAQTRRRTLFPRRQSENKDMVRSNIGKGDRRESSRRVYG